MSKKKKQPIPSNRQPSPTLLAALIAALAFLLYANTLSFDYSFDDDVYLVKNSLVQEGFSGIPALLSHGTTYGFDQLNVGTYRPLTLLSFVVEYQLGGTNSTFSHFINIVLYSLCCLLLFSLLRMWFPKLNIWIPFAICLLFAAHPIHAEVVASVKSRDELLCFLFGILSLRAFFRFHQHKQNKQLIISSLCFLLAIFSKETALTLLAIAPISLWLLADQNITASLKRALPLIGISGLYLILRSIILEPAPELDDPFINNSLLAAESFSQQLATNFLILGKYFQLLLYPHPLSYDYSYQQIPLVTFGDWRVILSVLGYLAMIGLSIGLWKKQKMLSFGLLWYLITLSISSNLFIKIGSTMAERFLFMPSLGFCLMLMSLLIIATKRKEEFLLGTSAKYVTAVVIGFILLVFGLKSVTRTNVWENNEQLFLSGIEAAPNSFRTHFNLGEYYRISAENRPPSPQTPILFQKAITSYTQSLQIYDHQPDTWYNLGVCFQRLGNQQQEQIAYEKCLKIRPDYAQAANNLGAIYFQQKQLEQALQYFQQAAQADPTYADAIGNIGAVYHNQGKRAKAIEYYQRCLAIDPNKANVRQNLAKLGVGN